MKIKAGIVLWVLLGGVVVGTTVLWRMKRPVEAGEVEPEKAVLVRTARVDARSISNMVTLPGHVAADAVARLSAEKNGRVVELCVDRGDRVDAGQVMLRMDARLWKAYSKRAQIEFADAERDLARWKKLNEEGAVSSSEYDAMQRRRDIAKVGVEEAAVNVSQCEVTSPIDGVVDARDVELGEYLVEGQPVFTVVNRDVLKIEVSVPERDIGALELGMRMHVRSAALPGQGLVGVVGFVAEAGDSGANTFAVELVVENPPASLKPGMLVDVELPRGVSENAIVVPLSAVIPKRGEHVVFVVENGRAVLRVVRIEKIIGQEVVLSSGVRAGDLLVVEGHRTLQDGVPVEIEGKG